MLQIHFKKQVEQADLLIAVVGINEPLSPLLKKIDAQLNGAILFNMQREGFVGQKDAVMEMTTNGLHTIPRIFLLGAGDAAKLAALEWQEIGGTISTLLKGDQIAIAAHEDCMTDLLFGLKLRNWRFTKHLSQKNEKIMRITILTKKSAEHFIDKDWLCEGVILARELTVEPANHLNPELFAQRCLELQNEDIEVQVYDEHALEAMGAHAILSVGKSSAHPPRLVTLRYNGGEKGTPPIALVGKGVCYDSGGINLKTEELVEMKFDKAGAAAVVGTMLAVAKQKTPINLVGVIGLAENMVDGASTKPGDIITTLSKITVEVVNTDYEGRLILADCLTFVQEKFKPSVIIDLGTLTPETVAPLADEYAGLYSEDAELVHTLFKAGLISGEKTWHLPMGTTYAKQIRSEYADIRNMGIPNFGEGAAAAEFLKRFIQPGVRWAHLDIAGVAWTLEHYPLNCKGITGYGVRLLIEFLKQTT
jgi:leucyl aminopeptidase